MTEHEREELIEKMARALAQSHVNGLVYQDAARAALAVAEPVIRDECAKICDRWIIMLLTAMIWVVALTFTKDGGVG